jgi:hypothetical protein
MLKDKKILFISPPYFSYPDIIKSGIESQRAKVDLFYSQPVGAISKFAAVCSTRIYDKLKERYFKVLHERIKGPYDYVLIIRADLIPEEFIGFLRHNNPGSIFIQYLWDDVGLFPALLDTFQYFNRILSYNIHDSKKYGLVFRPFFFIPDDEPLGEKPKKYDLFFIGIFHTDRLKVIEEIMLQNPGIKLYLHFYISVITFLKKGIPLKKLKLFRFRKMNYKEMIRIVKSSSAVLDIPKPLQKGLSTRIFEAMGAGAKVITTNEKVREYEFFNNNFLIIDRDKPLVNKEWLTLPFKDYENGLLSGYHVSTWIFDVFIK